MAVMEFREIDKAIESLSLVEQDLKVRQLIAVVLFAQWNIWLFTDHTSPQLRNSLFGIQF